MYEGTIEVEEQGNPLPPEEIDQDDEGEEDLRSEKTAHVFPPPAPSHSRHELES